MISWLGIVNLFQTFDQQALAKIENEIQEIRKLLKKVEASAVLPRRVAIINLALNVR
jgi:hypothetical protein